MAKGVMVLPAGKPAAPWAGAAVRWAMADWSMGSAGRNGDCWSVFITCGRRNGDAFPWCAHGGRSGCEIGFEVVSVAVGGTSGLGGVDVTCGTGSGLVMVANKVSALVLGGGGCSAVD